MEMEPSALLDLPVLAEFANVTSISVILLCLVGTTLFIYLFRMAEDLPSSSFRFGLHQRNMVKVSNPFVVELDERIKDLKDGLTFSLSTLCACHVVVVWGPEIQALHKLILNPGLEVRSKVLTNVDDKTDLNSLHNDFMQFKSEGKYTISLPCPECVTSESLGEMPRNRYPLAVFVFTPGYLVGSSIGQRSRDVPQEIESDNTIIGLFAIVHLKDSIITKNSHIIAKYVKTAGVPIYSLQALYVSSSSQSQQQTSGFDKDSEIEVLSATNTGESFHSSLIRSQPHAEFENTVESNEVSVSEGTDNSSSNSSPVHVETDSAAFSSTLVGNRQGPEDSRERADNSQRHPSVDVDNQSSCSSGLSNGESQQSTLKPLPECVVCQSRPAKCALLPCRHNCVCLGCLKLLEKCPMCRCALESFFIVTDKNTQVDNDEDDSDIENEDIDSVVFEMQQQGIAAHMENFFERINQMVGFR